MKNLAMLLGSGLIAMAIGCSEGGGTAPTPPTAPPGNVDYQKMMEKNAAPAGDAEKKEEAAEKKEEAAEKKEEAAEKKEEAAEKKEEAAEKKEEAAAKKE